MPDYIAHIAVASAPVAPRGFAPSLLPGDDQLAPMPFLPNDPGASGAPGGWEALQWNFDGQWGVQAPQAWANLIAAGHPGGYGAGIVVAVLDTGVAYADHGRYVRSPDFDASQFVAGYDFVSHTAYPEDRNGHGTQVAGTIAEETNNAIGVTGLAYGVRIMPVRVLNSQGNGRASTIAKGIMFAVRHHAQIINLSLEFDAGTVTAADIPQLIQAIDVRPRPQRAGRRSCRQRVGSADLVPRQGARRARDRRDNVRRLPRLLLELRLGTCACCPGRRWRCDDRR